VTARPITGHNRMLAVFGTLALLAAILVPATPAPASATTSYTITRSGGDGSDSTSAIVYTVTLRDFNCTTGSGFSQVKLDVSGIAGGPLNKHFRISLDFDGQSTNTTGCRAENSSFMALSDFSGNLSLGANPLVPETLTAVFRFVPAPGAPSRATSGLRILKDSTFGFNFFVEFDPASPPPATSSSPAPDPTEATSAVVAEQVAAGGIEGSLASVRVRGSEVVPSATARWLAANQGRLNTIQAIGGLSVVGGTSVVSDGLEVQVGSSIGARADRGVVVPSGGTLGASVTGALVPGSVVEVWINSQPRLVAAARVPEDGGTVAFAIPTGAPLDGGGAIEDGAHTLELRMYTEDGFEVVATGITIGQVVPTRIPAGEGPVPSGAVLLALLAAAGVVVAGRRLVTAG
jgi:hypothetical protein